MKIKDLIEKLEQQDLEKGRECNGTYAVIQLWYDTMIKLDPVVNNDSAFDCYFNNIYGTIIGLKTTHYISVKESDDLINDLMQIHHEFYAIKED